MKRKITNLEQKLLENGYMLVSKYYGGKHSEKVAGYAYQKGYRVILLDQKREKVINFGVQDVNVRFFDNKELEIITNELKDFNNFVATTLLGDKPLDKVLQDYDITLEKPLSNAKGKTFEQLDMENQEVESEEK